VLATQLAITRKLLSKEKVARSTTDRSLAKEKAARHATEQALQSSNDTKSELALELESTQGSLTSTHDKLISMSSALDTAVIQEQKMKI
jgi:hypothetical protein